MDFNFDIDGELKPKKMTRLAQALRDVLGNNEFSRRDLWSAIQEALGRDWELQRAVEAAAEEHFRAQGVLDKSLRELRNRLHADGADKNLIEGPAAEAMKAVLAELTKWKVSAMEWKAHAQALQGRLEEILHVDDTEVTSDKCDAFIESLVGKGISKRHSRTFLESVLGVRGVPETGDMFSSYRTAQLCGFARFLRNVANRIFRVVAAIEAKRAEEGAVQRGWKRHCVDDATQGPLVQALERGQVPDRPAKLSSGTDD